ncbi:cellulose binding domain-containing protein [Streptomyces cadmiisoli]|uniref:cellulose binding domain-containing protein n=1 Tax=Streptomyces cadmiisoli TaxID=2184053 RepID=UPI00366269EB
MTTEHALDDWRAGRSFRDGRRIGRMRDARLSRHGARAVATAADHNRTVPADGSLSFGFLSPGAARTHRPTASHGTAGTAPEPEENRLTGRLGGRLELPRNRPRHRTPAVLSIRV